MRAHWRERLTSALLVDVVALAVMVYVIVWSLHPSLLFSSSLLTGGDTGAHLVLPAFLRSQGDLLNLTPWYPGWFAGMPAYTYYFVLPDFLAVLASYLVGFAVAFKLATVLGSVLMPVAAYLMGRLFRAPRPVPLALAAATVPFLFDASFTIDGGNLFSTMAGEYAFALALALALIAIGLFARGVRTGRGYWMSALMLSATLSAHVLPWFFTIAAVGVLVVFELAQRRGHGERSTELVPGDYARPMRFALGAGLLSAGLSAWWLLPFGTSQSLTNSMGYTNDNVSSLRAVFTTLGWYNASGGAAGDRWVITLAALSFAAAFIVRDRLGMFLVSLTALSLGAFVVDPQGVIWNERLVPFWFIMIHLSAGWLVGYALARYVAARPRREVAHYLQSDRIMHEYDGAPIDIASDEPGSLPLESVPLEPESFEPASLEFSTSPHDEEAHDEERHRTRRVLRTSLLVLALGLASTVPGLVTPVANALGLSTSGNQVSSWAQWNYSGYQAKAAWPEYRDLMTTVGRVARRYGCGRAMWEYSANENRFGTPMALMLLPYWTNNCVDSMEGLFFESSATTPYHFLDQAELSASPSNPQVGLPYGTLNIFEGIEHLQMLGVKYYIAFSPVATSQANADPELRLVASTKAWPSPGVTWRIYYIKHSVLVSALHVLPNVVAGLSSRTEWLGANTTWWLDQRDWPVLAASSGPSSWPRAASVSAMQRSAPLPAVVLSHVRVTSQSVSFHVSRTGVPVLVKVSYYPRWHATGATGPYRVSPNLMVVVPTGHDVTLQYTSTPALDWGDALSNASVFVGLVVAWRTLRRRRVTRQ